MDTEGCLIRVVLVSVDKSELGGYGEVHLVGGDGELSADGAPHLHINLWSIERRFVRHLDEVDAARRKNISNHVLGLNP